KSDSWVVLNPRFSIAAETALHLGDRVADHARLLRLGEKREGSEAREVSFCRVIWDEVRAVVESVRFPEPDEPPMPSPSEVESIEPVAMPSAASRTKADPGDPPRREPLPQPASPVHDAKTYALLQSIDGKLGRTAEGENRESRDKAVANWDQIAIAIG